MSVHYIRKMKKIKKKEEAIYSMNFHGFHMTYYFIGPKDREFDAIRQLRITLYRMLENNYDNLDILFLTNMCKNKGKVPVAQGYYLPSIPCNIQKVSLSAQKIIVINGKGGSGKDSLIKTLPDDIYRNYSSIDTIKKAALMLGWNGEKDENGRLFLSSLKKLTMKHSFLLEEELDCVIKEFKDSEMDYLFIHIREPKEIGKVKERYPEIITLLIRSPWEQESYGNDSDDSVGNYDYDLIFFNEAGLEESGKKFQALLESCTKEQTQEQWH